MSKFVRINHNDNSVWGELIEDSVKILSTAPWDDFNFTDEEIPFDPIKLLAPVVPSKIVLIGLNYHDHIKESHTADEAPDDPLIFMKPPTTVIGPNDEIPYHDGLDRVDYEGELAAVIGKKIFKANENESKEAIFGYTILNDVTARNLQRKENKFTRGKGFDGFAPVGPWIVTGINPLDLKLETFLNDELKQSANTSLQIWNVYQLTRRCNLHRHTQRRRAVSTGRCCQN
jgi:2-keto-4-pentenoate hydratase/2-oxohepta-3-ene-1,7-dioic acid hydratase in catechol pathway